MKIRHYITLGALVGLALLVCSCDSSDKPRDPNPWGSSCFLPYVRNDQNYTSYVSVLNRSEYWTDITITYRDPAGNTVATVSRSLRPRAVRRYTRANFTGSVAIEGIGSMYALQCQLETRENAARGAALAQRATCLSRSGVSWFFHLGVTDEGPGQTRTSLIAANPWYTGTIYAEYHPLRFPCSYEQAEIPAGGLHTLRPLDGFVADFPNGMSQEAISVSADPDPAQYIGFTAYTGARWLESPDGDIGLVTHTKTDANLQSWGASWHAFNGCTHIYLVDIKDGTGGRTDRLLLKRNLGSSSQTEVQFKLHFYDEAGNEVQGSPRQVGLVDQHTMAGSYAVLSPRTLLGHIFAGSIWIEPAVAAPSTSDPCGGQVARLQAEILRQSPTHWIDLSEASPGRCYPSEPGGLVPHVSTEDSDWIYQIILYYPGPLYPPQAAPVLSGDLFGSPSDEPPDATDGVVVLRFYDENGWSKGWLAFQMQPNETRYLRIDDLVDRYFDGSFTGSVWFTPFLPSELEMWHTGGSAHGSTGTWTVFDR